VPQQPATSFADDLKGVRDDFASDLAQVKDAVEKEQPVPHPVVKRLLDWLPAAGGLAGGLIGGAASSPFGAVPGAIVGAAAGGAGGRAVENMINAAIGNPAPPTVLGNLASEGRAAATQGIAEVGGRALTAGAKALAPVLMQSAVKPGLKATARAVIKGVAPEDMPIVKTLLDEGINVTRGGVDKLTAIINGTQSEIGNAIGASQRTIQTANVAKRLDPLMAQKATQSLPQSDVSMVQAARDEFLASHPPDVPIQRGQAIKIGDYQALGNKAYTGELKSTQIETGKALARGWKEEIEAEAAKDGVNLKSLNAREGAATTAREAVAKRVAQSGNSDLHAVAWLAGHPASGLAWLAQTSPAVKSMLARGLYKPAIVLGNLKIPQNVLRGMVAAVASENEPQIPEKQP
jgi:hypothetical protein